MYNHLFVETDDDLLLLCEAEQRQRQVHVDLSGVLAVQGQRRDRQAICRCIDSTKKKIKDEWDNVYEEAVRLHAEPR